MAEIVSYHFGVRDAKMAAWTAAETYGAAFDVGGIREFTLNLTLQTGQAEGDDVVLDRFSKIISLNARLSYVSVDQVILSLLTGATLSSGASYERVLFGQADNVPYFAIAARIMGSNTADMHIFIPKCKISGNLQYQAQYGNYLIPQVDIEGVWEGATNGFGYIDKYAAATELVLPPVVV